jgi:hypothetical protein
MAVAATRENAERCRSGGFLGSGIEGGADGRLVRPARDRAAARSSNSLTDRPAKCP